MRAAEVGVDGRQSAGGEECVIEAATVASIAICCMLILVIHNTSLFHPSNAVNDTANAWNADTGWAKSRV